MGDFTIPSEITKFEEVVFTAVIIESMPAAVSD
jgi:hypothetical protein